jgi:peptidoglycan/xylan/chitin deacetylase (PgdA/CDA1 family)
VPLHGGDRLRTVDGHDRIEPTRRAVHDAGVRVGNPERTLDVYPTTVVSVIGRISDQIASVDVHSRGDGHAPREVALTFDDGPWPGSTRRILAILRRFHAHATFFMVGAQAARYPELVRKVAAGGNEIGNHSFSHPITLRSASPATVTDELARTNTVLTRDGATPTLFRPPGGWFDDHLVQAARREGMRLVTWSVDPDDWKSDVTWKQIRDSVLTNVRPGSIVLLHDGGGDAGHTIRALPAIIRGIRQEGLRLVLVPPRPA